MKRLLAIILVFVFAFSLTSCNKNNEHNELIIRAIEEVEKTLKEEIASNSNGYFEIKNTRIIEIKENDAKIFKDVAYVVEFLEFVDFYGSAPYYNYVGAYDSAIIYKSGKIEVSGNPFHRYTAITYSVDFSNIINSITDYGDEYNCVKYLK